MSTAVTFVHPPKDYVVSVDFLRVTHEIWNAPSDFQFFALDHMQDERRAGHRLSPYQISDMKGAQCGGGAIAQSKTHLLSEFRGESAERMYQYYLTMSGKCTRIDFAITLLLSGDDKNLPVRCHEMATAYMRREGANPNYKRPTLMGGDGGWTSYHGSRSSDRMLRIYDRWRKTGDIEHKFKFRFEVELKGARAREVWLLMRAGTNPYEQAKAEIAAMLKTQGLRLDGIDAAVPASPSGQKRMPSDVHKTLEWLNSQVKPTVQDLIARGFSQDVLMALGLREEEIEPLLKL